RAVSAENILIARAGVVKVLDVGIARLAGDEDKASSMPPELLRGGGPLDLRADVYALGVVLYQLLSGAEPYEEKQGAGSLRSIILSQAPVPLLERKPDLPKELAVIVGRAMARDRDARYPTCREMQEALEDFIVKRGEPAGSLQLAQLVTRARDSGLLEDDPPIEPGGRAEPGESAPTPEAASLVSETEASSLLEIELSASQEIAPGLAPAFDFVEFQPTAEPAGGDGDASAEGNGAFGLDIDNDPLSWVGFSRNEAPGGPPMRAGDTELGLELEPDRAAAAEPLFELDLGRAAPTLVGMEQGTTSDAIESLPPAPRPQAPGSASKPATGLIARPVAAVSVAAPPEPRSSRSPARLEELLAAARELPYRPCSVASEATQAATRESAVADRSRQLLRRLPDVLARLLESMGAVPPQLREALAGLVAAALLIDDHASLRRLAERALSRPGSDNRFAALMAAELGSPLTIVWLAERLRTGLPADPGSARAWLTSLDASGARLLLWAIDSMEQGPGQELLCDALAPMVARAPAAVLARLEEPKPRNLAAMCYLLEKAQVRDRSRAFQKLQLRREPSVLIALMTGRARAGGSEVFNLLEAGVGDRSEEVRAHALRLLGETGDIKAVSLLSSQTQQASFELRPVAERKAFWSALAATGSDSALASFEQALGQKTTLLNKKKSVEAKLLALEPLACMEQEGAGRLLARTLAEKGQPDEVVTAARAALARRATKTAGAPVKPDPKAAAERRMRAGRSMCLDLALLARAATTVDLGSGLLDPALERFREEVLQTVLQEGRLQVVAEERGVLVNNVLINFGCPSEDLGVSVAQILQARDLRGLAVEAPIPTAELRACLLRLLDPDGEAERAPHVKVATVSRRSLAPPPEPPAPQDPTARSREIYLQVVAFLARERESVRLGRLAAIEDAHPLLEEWARLYASGSASLLGLLPARTGELSFAVHSANTALLAMAFASDLGLGRSALRDLAELALFWTLGDVGMAPEPRVPAGDPVPEETRVRIAWSFLAQHRSRRGPAQAVAAIEAGLDASGDGAHTPGTSASIFAIVEAWDSLSLSAGMAPAQALETMKGRLRPRFRPDLLELFTRWVAAQAGAGAGS
ncbi:MAG: protein kinase, partial [Deltaproteobacteria bacterium]|nr:protein kinase [Deltaproteobacteria bacterium]